MLKSLPSLQTLHMARCRGLAGSLELKHAGLQNLYLPGARRLTQLTVTSDLLTDMDVSGCVALEV